MSNPVVWFEILGKDGEGLKKFYGEIFEWKIDSNNPMNYGVANTGSEKGIQGGIGSADGGMEWASFYVEVKDIDSHLKLVEKNGGKTIVPRTVIPDMVTFAIFSDPEGNSVGLLESAPEE